MSHLKPWCPAGAGAVCTYIQAMRLEFSHAFTTKILLPLCHPSVRGPLFLVVSFNLCRGNFLWAVSEIPSLLRDPALGVWYFHSHLLSIINMRFNPPDFVPPCAPTTTPGHSSTLYCACAVHASTWLPNLTICVTVRTRPLFPPTSRCDSCALACTLRGPECDDAQRSCDPSEGNVGSHASFGKRCGEGCG
jgi:hypothetical protein